MCYLWLMKLHQQFPGFPSSSVGAPVEAEDDIDGQQRPMPYPNIYYLFILEAEELHTKKTYKKFQSAIAVHFF